MAAATELLDFLYADHERVASFLSQIEGEGTPKATEKSATKGKKTTKEGGLKLGLAEAGAGSELDLGQEVRLTYDPLWSNSRKLIEYVEGRSSDTSAPFLIGQLRVLSGKLIVYNFSSLRDIMNAEAMEEFIANGMKSDEQLDNRSPKARKDEQRKEASVIREFIKGLPLGIGFTLVTSTSHFWFSVNRDFLSLYELDIPLKFPTHISGDWNVLGVIDAVANDQVSGLQGVLDRNIDGLIPAMVLHMMQLTGAMTGMFGRSLQAYGLSPLVVYRRVTT